MVNGKSSSSSKGSPKKGITSSNRTATINRDDADDDVDEQNGDVHEEDEDNGVVNDVSVLGLSIRLARFIYIPVIFFKVHWSSLMWKRRSKTNAGLQMQSMSVW